MNNLTMIRCHVGEIALLEKPLVVVMFYTILSLLFLVATLATALAQIGLYMNHSRVTQISRGKKRSNLNGLCHSTPKDD